MSDEKIVRRDVKARGTKWAKTIAGILAKTGVTPNQISLASMLFAVLAAASMITSFYYDGLSKTWFLIGAALFIQIRLLCNLFDGMVAVEGGKKTASGDVFNDFPDRIADPLIIVSAGYAIQSLPFSLEIAWIAGLTAVLTAYVRVLGGACGLEQEFGGPMAKQHRMALITAALLLTAATTNWDQKAWIIYTALSLIAVGSWVTVILRVSRILGNLERNA